MERIRAFTMDEKGRFQDFKLRNEICLNRLLWLQCRESSVQGQVWKEEDQLWEYAGWEMLVTRVRVVVGKGKKVVRFWVRCK